MTLPSGNWYILVMAESTWPSWGKQYSLTATLPSGNVEVEQNGNPAGATPMTASGYYSGTSQPLYFVTDQTVDQDYYSFQVDQPAALAIDFTVPSGLSSSANAYTVSIVKSTGSNSISYLYRYQVKGDGSGIAGNNMTIGTGTWYLVVEGQSSSPAWGKKYQVKLSLTRQSGVSYESEDNNSMQTATTLPLGQTMQGTSNALYTLNSTYYDDDWYKLTIPNGGLLGLSLTWTPRTSTAEAYYVDLQDSSGNILYQYNYDQLTGDKGDGTWLSQRGITVPSGTLYLRIRSQSDKYGWGKTYTLKATMTNTSGNWESEPNGTTATADSLSLGSTIQGTSAAAEQYADRDQDYYTFTAASAGNYKLNFTFPATSGTASAYIIKVTNAQNTSVKDYQLTANQSDGTWADTNPIAIPASGTYYINVTGLTSYPTWTKTYNLGVEKQADHPHDPVGAFEDASVSGQTTINVKGWAADWDSASQAVTVRACVGGDLSTGECHDLTANTTRTDIGSQNPGLGNNHGFQGSFTTAKLGSQQVKVYAININGTTGSNVLLGTKTVGVAPLPVGSFEIAQVVPQTTISVRGWAADWDDPTRAVQVTLCVGGDLQTGECHTMTANQTRADIGAKFPGLGNNHGFQGSFTTAKLGSQAIKLYGINLSGTAGADGLLGTKTVGVAPLPVGSLELATSPSAGTLSVRGWAADWDSPSTSIQVKACVGGTLTTGECHTLTANQTRADIGTKFPGLGNNHGFQSSFTTAKTGAQSVNLYGVNAPGTAGADGLLKTVTVNISSTAANVPSVQQADATSTPATTFSER
ncbi:MAG: hypothetical protein LBR32_00715 [Propionibacteriaceae bacterium]|nr:hypothetical protein [Propionibacteriaceae bacterium]